MQGAAMKGNPTVLERLSEALFLELAAVNQYWLHFDNFKFIRVISSDLIP